MRRRTILFAALATAAFSRAGERVLWPAADTDIRAQSDSVLTWGADGAAVVRTGAEYPWPGLCLSFRDGKPRDLSDVTWIEAGVSNTTDQAVEVVLHVKSRALQGRSPSGSIRIAPHASGTLHVNLRLMPWRLDVPLELKGMNGYPQAGDATQLFDIRNTTAFHFFRGGRARPAGFAIRRVVVGTDSAQTAETLRAAEFLPFVDAYGQFRHAEWPGKVHSDEGLAKFRKVEAAWLEQHAGGPIPDADRFGGWAGGPKLKATGRFRTEKVRGKWWLVDPDGRLFFSHGVTCVHGGDVVTGIGGRENYFAALPEKDDPRFGFCWGKVWKAAAHGFYSKTENVPYDSYNFGAANMVRKYGEGWREISYDLAHRRLRAWGLNTIANWSQPEIFRMDRTPYTATFSTRGPVIAGSGGWWGKFRDPFAPEFARNIREAAEKEAARSGSDEWCIGWFVDNELSFGNDGFALGRAILKSPADQPAKEAARNLLVGRHGTIAALNAAWGTDFPDWNAFMAATSVPDESRSGADLRDIHALCVNRYFSVVADAIRRAAPGMLYLGSRIAWGDEAVYRAAARHCDVVSVNVYERQITRDLPDGADDKPMIVGEFHFGALDRGMFHTGLVATADQRERAEAYVRYVGGCLDHPRYVGTHWFQWKDQPLAGRADGEDYQIGFLTVTDTPYPELVKAAIGIGRTMYERRYHAH